MKLHLLDRSHQRNSSFTVKRHSHPHFLKIWHYHPELELVAIIKSSGTRFIGDGIAKFQEGEVVLIGENLPHMWVNEDVYFDSEPTLTAESVAIHFKSDFFGPLFLEAPELTLIAQLFMRAERGIKFTSLEEGLFQKINRLPEEEGFGKTVQFLEILHSLALEKNYELLSSNGFIKTFNRTENKKLDRIYAYVFKNFGSPIGSKEVALVANMNTSAFSRFFKRMHRKTFTQYLNEIRIGYACKLLLEQKFNISEICFESGFNNISNFNRQFKKIKGMAPKEYVRHHTKIKEVQVG
ncbi:MAG: AraC family transcriptional regulator [Sediminicola sp.]